MKIFYLYLLASFIYLYLIADRGCISGPADPAGGRAARKTTAGRDTSAAGQRADTSAAGGFLSYLPGVTAADKSDSEIIK